MLCQFHEQVISNELNLEEAAEEVVEVVVAAGAMVLPFLRVRVVFSSTSR